MDKVAMMSNINIEWKVMNIFNKVLFLDIDGVLNSEEYFIGRKDRDQDLDITKVRLLEDIIKDTNCTIVLSSSWRIFGLDRINNEFKKIGSNIEIKFRTTLEDKDRGLQINEFIHENNIDDYVVLDDEAFDIKKYVPSERFIKTTWKQGLTVEESNKIIQILN